MNSAGTVTIFWAISAHYSAQNVFARLINATKISGKILIRRVGFARCAMN